MFKPKANIEKVFRTPPDTGSRRGFLRLDKNDRLIPFPKEIWNRFMELFDETTVMTYPEQEEFYRKLALYIGVPREHLLLSLGSDLAIKMVYETFIDAGQEVQLHLPSYAMYSVYNNIFQADASSISFNEYLKLDIQKFINSISNKTRLVVVENPNGFIGEKLEFEDLKRIAEKAYSTDTIFLIDEAYYQFMGDTSQELYLEFENVIIVRSFSKDFGMAGLRCGYLLSQKQNIDMLYRVKPMNETNSAAIAFGLAVLDYPNLIQDYIEVVKKNIIFLKSALSSLGFTTAGGNGNFIIIYVGGAIDRIIQMLKNRGVLVRRPFQVESLHGWLRVGIGTKSDMERFIDCFKKVYNVLNIDNEPPPKPW